MVRSGQDVHPPPPSVPSMRKPGLSQVSGEGAGASGLTDKSGCRWDLQEVVQLGAFLHLGPGLYGKLQSEVPFSSRPGPPSARGAGAVTVTGLAWRGLLGPSAPYTDILGHH